ncbi:MAG TPA: protein kinase, partial [Kofleriaceae bacterium]
MATDEVDSFLRGVASAPALRPPPRIGERLGDRYVIEAFLGEGGMGSVFRALDEKLGEQVALKIVKPGLDEDALHDEVRLAQKVTHVNVCRTFDLEELDGRHVVKMEYIAGETLAKRLDRDGKLAIDEAVRIARAIASGLGVAHAQGIVHSDLKPGNVMLADRRIVLMDFGVAHLAASPNDGVHGTVGYLAPEKLREESGDARSDEYALGCVLYEMLTGEPVFGRGSAIAIATRHVGEAPPDVRAKRPEVPRWLARVVARLLAKDPANRAIGVARLVSGPPSRLRVALPATLLVLIAAVAGWRVTRSPVWSPALWSQPDHIEDIDDPAVSPNGEWIMFSTDRYSNGERGRYELALTSLRTRETTRLITTPELESPNSPRWVDDHTIMFVATNKGRRLYKQYLDGSPPQLVGTPTIETPEDVTNVMSAEKCGDAFVYIRWTLGAPMELWSTTSNKPLFKALGTSSLSAPRCDPKGERIAVVLGTSFFGAGDVYLVDRASGENHPLTTDASVDAGAIFSHDGRSIIAGRRVDDKIHLYERLITGGQWRPLTSGEGPDATPDISSDGKVLAFTRDTSLFLVSIVGKPGLITTDKASHIRPRPVDRDHIVTQRDGRGPSEVTLVSLSTGEVKPLAPGTDPFPSADGKTIYFVPPGSGGELASERRILAT